MYDVFKFSLWGSNIMFTNHASFITSLLMTFLLLGCNSNNQQIGNSSENTAPAAHVSAATTKAIIGIPLVLDGSASSDADGDTLTYLWSLTVPTGSGAVLDNVNAQQPQFIPDTPGDYIATLVVNDGKVDSEAMQLDIAAIEAAPNSATLTWTAPTKRADNQTDLATSDIAGYTIYYGTTLGGPYAKSIPVSSDIKQYNIAPLDPGTYYFVVTASDTDGLESSYSLEGSKTIQ